MKSPALLLASFLILTSLNASAQSPATGTISGTVSDRTTGQPVQAVGVILAGTSYGIRTNANGQYTILGVPAGAYTVVATRVGYSRMEIGNVVVRTDVPRKLDIEMRSSAQVPPPAVEPGPAPIVEQGRMGAPPDDPFSRCLIPPELIMAHQSELNLQDAQRTKLIAEMSQAQAKFTEVQWTMGSEQQKLEQLLSGPAIDEAAAMRQLERIISIEQGLKRSQMTLLIRVKNTLTPAQLATIAELRRGSRTGSCGA